MLLTGLARTSPPTSLFVFFGSSALFELLPFSPHLGLVCFFSSFLCFFFFLYHFSALPFFFAFPCLASLASSFVLLLPSLFSSGPSICMQVLSLSTDCFRLWLSGTQFAQGNKKRVQQLQEEEEQEELHGMHMYAHDVTTQTRDTRVSDKVLFISLCTWDVRFLSREGYIIIFSIQCWLAFAFLHLTYTLTLPLFFSSLSHLGVPFVSILTVLLPFSLLLLHHVGYLLYFIILVSFALP